MYDAVQLTGSLLILAAFVLTMAGRLPQGAPTYLLVNTVGSALLTGTAIVGREWGFLLLEGVWAVVSLAGLARALRGRAAARH